MPKIERISEMERSMIESYREFSVVDEDYGFSVRPGRRRRRRATMVEWAAQYMGFLCIFGTFGLVAGSTGLSGSRLDIFEVGLFVAGALAAGAFFWIGTRGTAIELQVDSFRRQFRTAIRNHKGAVRVMETFDFAQIESAFVHQLSKEAFNADLSIRTQKDPNGVVLLRGNARALNHLHAVLANSTLKPVAARIPLRNKKRSLFNQRASLAAE